MFRELVRKKQKLTEAECVAVLRQQKRGVLSVLGEDGYPYGMPLNHWYSEEDGKLYFHSGKTGHKIDAMRAEEKVSYCVYDEGFRRPGEWALNIRSVIVFGRISFIEDPEEAIRVTRRLSLQFTEDDAYIENEIRRFTSNLLVFALTPEHICGKIVNES